MRDIFCRCDRGDRNQAGESPGGKPRRLKRANLHGRVYNSAAHFVVAFPRQAP